MLCRAEVSRYTQVQCQRQSHGPGSIDTSEGSLATSRQIACRACCRSFLQRCLHRAAELCSRHSCYVPCSEVKGLQDLGQVLLVDLLCSAEEFSVWRALSACRADLSRVRVQARLVEQVSSNAEHLQSV